MIILRDITLRRGGKLLLHNAQVTIQPGQHLALIGANGSGKSSLFALLLGELAPDGGEIEGLNNLRLAHMAQEIQAGPVTACEFVWRADERLATLMDSLRDAQSRSDFAAAAPLHTELDVIDGYSAQRRALRLLEGLGFKQEDGARRVDDFSGGWRSRLNLARALTMPSDVLLLDEPTNHLDLDATLWLQQWLQRYPGTLLLISHDRDFIDATCTRTLHIERHELNAYRGNYSDFESQRAQRLAQQQALFEKQQRRAAEIEAFVQRFRYQATKARQAQSRLKELERMQAAAPAHADSPFDFRFANPAKSSDPLLRLDEAVLGYGDTAVLREVDLILRPGTRLGLLGRNGAGKSTLLRSLSGDLPLLAGRCTRGEHLRSGYFHQQQLEALDLQASPFLHLLRLDPAAREQEILDFLGGFDFRGAAVAAPVAPLSGGEKARLALAMLVWQRPNLLVLDEPTNHLDLEMRHAMEVALQGFEGALILVSHDRHLLRNTVEELMLVHDGRVEQYRDDLAGYERWILSAVSRPAPEASSAGGGKRREKRQQAAAQRERLRPLRRDIEMTERAMAQISAELEALQARLAEPALYDEAQRDELADLLRREGALKARADSLDETWLEQQQTLEALQLNQSD